MSAYQRFADELGFVIVAQSVDPATDDEAYGRHYYILATLDLLRKRGILRNDPVMIGGASGGAKWAMHLGEFGGSIYSGVLAIVCNEDFSSYGYNEIPNPSSKGVKIYLLNGKNDSIAGQDGNYNDMIASLKTNGFWNVQAAFFDGGHEVPYAETKRVFEDCFGAGRR
jgi:predicted esterase